MVWESKYKPKYAKQLAQGMNDAKGRPMSIMKCCLTWGVTAMTYYAWIEKYPKFAASAEQAKQRRAAWWEDLNMDVAEGEVKGNAGLIQFALKNIDGINWADKVEVNNHYDEQINILKIERLPSYEERKKIAFGDAIEGQLIEQEEHVEDPE